MTGEPQQYTEMRRNPCWLAVPLILKCHGLAVITHVHVDQNNDSCGSCLASTFMRACTRSYEYQYAGHVSHSSLPCGLTPDPSGKKTRVLRFVDDTVLGSVRSRYFPSEVRKGLAPTGMYSSITIAAALFIENL